MIPLAVRLSDETYDRLARVMERLRRRFPGVVWTRSNVLRSALLRYLDEQEREAERDGEEAA